MATIMRRTPPPIPRPARSKTGCSTCRHRKVRCDEQRPRCSHCERLNLNCRWRSPHSHSRQWKFVISGVAAQTTTTAPAAPVETASQVQQSSTQTLPGLLSPTQNDDNPPAHAVADDAGQSLPETQTQEQNQLVTASNDTLTYPWMQTPGAVDRLFDFDNFMWDAGGVLGHSYSPEQPMPQPARFLPGNTGFQESYPMMRQPSPATANAEQSSTPATGTDLAQGTGSTDTMPARQDVNPSIAMVVPTAEAPGDHYFISYFVDATVPPILAEVETQKRWSAMRQMLISMANASEMVRCSILAFASLLCSRQETPWLPCLQTYYERASEKLVSNSDVADPTADDTIAAATATTAVTVIENRQHLLATIFFLCYIDILDHRVENAHAHLRRAYHIFQQGKQRGFRPVEIRLLSWIRLLDARAVSAGGEGLFLSDSSDSLIITSATPKSPHDSAETVANEALDQVKEWDTNDVLFQVLSHPGIVFFQKVQSFMGRISKIDPWHRSRGTVEDETDVMHIASKIAHDLRELYHERPALMDIAVGGGLAAPHVSPGLATAITRAFRTYLSNYHASKVHLHRVAYKHLPLNKESGEALSQIRHITKLLAEDLEPNSALPVSQLWPLLMLGSETNDTVERAWIKEQILQMEKVATNARITAHVLEETQARQDATKGRVDIRSVMHEVFDSCFAIV